MPEDFIVRGRRFLAKIAEDQRNWNSGLADADALFHAAEEASPLAKQLPQLRDEVQAIRAKKDELEAQARAAQTELNSLGADLREARRIDALRAHREAEEVLTLQATQERETAEKQRDAVRAEVEKLRAAVAAVGGG
jgi:chromosome segregation ATPase